MKKLYALCVIVLLAVVYDVFVHRASPVEAQTGRGPVNPAPGRVGIVTIHRTSPAKGPLSKESNDRWSVKIDESKVLGFSCMDPTDNSAAPVCYLAAGN